MSTQKTQEDEEEIKPPKLPNPFPFHLISLHILSQFHSQKRKFFEAKPYLNFKMPPA